MAATTPLRPFPSSFPLFQKMYIGTALAAAQLSSNSNEFTNIMLKQEKGQLEWLENAMRMLCTAFFFELSGVCSSYFFLLLRPGESIVNIVNAITAWLVHIAPSLSEFNLLNPTPPGRSTLRKECVPCAINSRLMDQTLPQRGLHIHFQLHLPSVCVWFNVTIYDYLIRSRSIQ